MFVVEGSSKWYLGESYTDMPEQVATVSTNDLQRSLKGALSRDISSVLNRGFQISAQYNSPGMMSRISF